MFLQLHEMQIFYKIIGTGIPIIMIHGWGPDHRSLEGCLECLFKGKNKNFKRIYFDLPGLGQTKGNDWLTSTDKMLELVIEFIDKIIPDENFVIVGESYGGYLARGIVKIRQDKVLGLLLKCPLAKHETQFQNAPTHIVLEKDKSIIKLLNDEEKTFFEPVIVKQTKNVFKIFKQTVLPGLKIADYNYINNNWGKRAPFSYDIDQIDNPFNGPVLIIMGKQDSMVGYTDSWNYLKNYTRASFVILDKAGHNLQIEQIELFNALTKEWLERIKEYIKNINES